jgi:hypothetical protein
VDRAVPAADHARRALPERRDEVGLALDRRLERRPDLADAFGEMGVRRAERRETQSGGDSTRPTGVMGPVLRVVGLDGVDGGPVAADGRPVEAHVQELRMRDQYRRVLPAELGHRRVEREEVGDRVGQPEREHVLAVSPRSGEQLAAGHHQQILVGERTGRGPDVRKTGEMRRVHHGVETVALGPADHALVENLDVWVDAGLAHGSTVSILGAGG